MTGPQGFSARYWPLYRLRLTTPRLELRLPDTALLDELAGVAAAGVHAAHDMPFSVPWTDVPDEQRGRAVFQHVLGSIAQWQPSSWRLLLVVRCDGQVVGLQELSARDFAVLRETATGSWLGRAHQGRGIGTEMRAAVLQLAFSGLGAHSAVSAAMTDNPRSAAVSRRLGYTPDGQASVCVQGRARALQRLRLDRARWEAHRTVPVEVHGLGPCRELFTGTGRAPQEG